MNLISFFVIPGYTFFYWGFTLKKENYKEFIDYFGLKEDNLFESITLEINRKKYNAKIRIARQNNQGKGRTGQMFNTLLEMLSKYFMIEKEIPSKP